jgi:hypothetical protein
MVGVLDPFDHRSKVSIGLRRADHHYAAITDEDSGPDLDGSHTMPWVLFSLKPKQICTRAL